jgi:peptide/nickel transport system substrate-binding protein
MTKKWLSRTAVVAATGVAALVLAACSGGGGSSSDTSGSGTPTKGGTVTWIDSSGQWEATDPAGVYLGEEIAALRRIVFRGLTALPITSGKTAPKPVGDLATDAGTTKDGGKTWSFTLKDGVKWQDGKDITCADLQYGLSRSYDASLVATGSGVGTTYFGSGAYNLIDPADPSYDLSTEYTGPLTGSAEAQAHFNNAASCEGKTITYHFQNTWLDFPYAAAALFTTDPYEKSFEKGTANQWKINSNGPYVLQGDSYDTQVGGTFVRNKEYDASTDSTKVRGAYPDTVKFDMVADSETATERLIADSGADQTAFTPLNIPSDKYSEIDDSMSSRVVQSVSPYTRFLEFNHKTLTDPNVRNALVLATDRAGALAAYGGDKYGSDSTSIVSNTVPGFTENSLAKTTKPGGDAAAAKALLAKTSNPTPSIKFSFPDTPTNENVAAAIQAGWQKAGFKVELAPIATSAKPGYYTQMSSVDKTADVFFAGWAADWPSLFPSVQPILLSNPADAKNGVGFNYGFYSNSAVDDLIKQASNTGDTAQFQKLLSQADDTAAKDGAYAPLLNQKNYFIHGSKLGGFLPDGASSFYPDLGAMYVEK